MKKKKLKSMKSLKAKAWKFFSEFIRKRGSVFDMTRCYTCGIESHWKYLQCGHAIGGRGNAVLFDPDICRPQCQRCNVFLRGNYPIFTSKLIREFGLEWFEQKLANSKRPVKITRQDLEDIILRFSTARGRRMTAATSGDLA